MNLLNNIKRNAKKVFVTLLAIAVLAVPATALASFFPDRPVKDWNNVADRGGFDKVVFNSFINTPYYGDERYFLDTRVGSGNDEIDNYKDVLNGVKDGDVLTLRSYVHNNGNQDLNGANMDGPTVAKDAKVRVLLPTGTANSLRATSYISASNAANGDANKAVSDTTDFVGANGAQINVSYVADSAFLVNCASYNLTTKKCDGGGREFKLSNNVVSSGAPIGFDQMNGSVPGCFQYQSFVYIKVKVSVPSLSVQKQVKVAGGTYQEAVAAKPGDTVSWRVAYKNVGSGQINNTVLKDALPAGVTVVPNTVKLVDAAHKTGLKLTDTDLFDANGTNAGSYTAGSNGYITFDTKVNTGKLPSCTIKNVVTGQATGTPVIEDAASVNVECTTPTTPPTPPTIIPSTGAGDVIGIFAAVTAAGTIAHRLVLSRRRLF